MRVKRFLVSLFLVVALVLSSISTFAFAAPKAGSSGFKSGGFKSSAPKITSPIKPSSGSSFKSGIFKKATPKVTTPNTSKKYSTSQKSYIPIPFPIPMFRSHYYGGFGYPVFSFWYFIKLIIKLILLIMFIKFLLKIFRR